MSDEPATCPRCGKVCKNRRGMRIHHTQTHGESLLEETAACEHCGEDFDVPSGSTGTYCSRECYAASIRNRVTLECDNCGEDFDVAGYDVDRGRRYCSRECYWDTLENQVQTECAGCGRTISVHEAAGIAHCSKACEAEARTSAPRPDDVDGLLWLLYVYEDHNARNTWLRANANLEPDEQLTQRETKERLRENDWMVGAGRPKYEDLTIEDVGLGDDEVPSDRTWRKYYQDREEVSAGD